MEGGKAPGTALPYLLPAHPWVDQESGQPEPSGPPQSAMQVSRGPRPHTKHGRAFPLQAAAVAAAAAQPGPSRAIPGPAHPATPEARASPDRPGSSMQTGKPAPLYLAPLTSTSTATTAASVPSVPVPAAPRAVLLLLIDLFGLGHLDFTLKTKRTGGQATGTSSGQRLYTKIFTDKHSDGQPGPLSKTKYAGVGKHTVLAARRTVAKTRQTKIPTRAFLAHSFPQNIYWG